MARLNQSIRHTNSSGSATTVALWDDLPDLTRGRAGATVRARVTLRLRNDAATARANLVTAADVTATTYDTPHRIPAGAERGPWGPFDYHEASFPQLYLENGADVWVNYEIET